MAATLAVAGAEEARRAALAVAGAEAARVTAAVRLMAAVRAGRTRAGKRNDIS
jgi:hypothetical protein